MGSLRSDVPTNRGHIVASAADVVVYLMERRSPSRRRNVYCPVVRIAVVNGMVYGHVESGLHAEWVPLQHGMGDGGRAALAAQMESGELNGSARHYEIFIYLMIGDGDTYY
jgi:hypothetical protein